MDYPESVLMAEEIARRIGKITVVPAKPKEYTQNILFEEQVQAGEELTLADTSRITGNVQEILYSFKAGCRGYAKLKIFVGTNQVLPEKGWLALDGITDKMTVRRPVEAGEKITAIFRNDGIFPHTLTAVVTIVGR